MLFLQCIVIEASPLGGRNASTNVKPYFDEPVCTIQVDVYCTLPVLVMSSWRWAHGFETCTCRRYCEI